ncbi:M13 family metallopeptidase [soil metagenome]
MSQGIDLTQLDPSISPADDLFRHVNGPWLTTAAIPADRATTGSFVDLHDESEKKIRAIIEAAREAEDPDADQRKIGDLYASFMDADQVEKLGATPLVPLLTRVDEIDSIASFITTLGYFDRLGVSSFVSIYIAPDEGQPDRYAAYFNQSGLGLPDESYFRGEDFAEIRAAYRVHLATMFGLAGLDDVEMRAERVFELEAAIASHHWDRVTTRDAQKTYNPMSKSELRALAPTIDWDAWAEQAQIPDALFTHLIVGQPSYVEGLQSLLTDEHLAGWSDWLRWKVIHSSAPYLSAEFVDANFAFYGRTLSGTAELRERWKRGVGFTEGAMGEALGRIYVSTEYPAAAKARMEELIANLISAYRESISALPWMSAETKKRALDKLAAFTPKIGHPQKWRDYSKLSTTRDDLLTNVMASRAFAMDRELAKLGAPIDRDEWYMTPQTVNAYYNPTMNEIVFPAAILQPPFFGADADDAVNYGAIGSVIGHEIGHGFDDQGSHYDGTGALSNWWTDDDRTSFEELTGALIKQYDALSPAGADGRTVNGALTIGENIGDLGGLSISYKAFRMSLGGVEPEPVDGLSADQRFFISWAQAWQTKSRDTETVRRLTVDPHSPPEFRCNQVVRNLDAFYQAFGVTDEHALWLDPAERVSIW